MLCHLFCAFHSKLNLLFVKNWSPNRTHSNHFCSNKVMQLCTPIHVFYFIVLTVLSVLAIQIIGKNEKKNRLSFLLKSFQSIHMWIEYVYNELICHLYTDDNRAEIRNFWLTTNGKVSDSSSQREKIVASKKSNEKIYSEKEARTKDASCVDTLQWIGCTRTTVNNKFIIEYLSDMILIKFTAVLKKVNKWEKKTHTKQEN